MSEIWVISEQTTTILELIAHAKGLSRGEKVIAWTFSEEEAQRAAVCGADMVYILEGKMRPEAWVNTIIECAQTVQPTAVLWGSSKRAIEMASRVAGTLDVGLISECIRVERGQEFVSDRYIYGGLCVATEVTDSQPFMATMVAKLIEALPEGTAVNIDTISGASDRVQVVELRAKQTTSRLGDANVVVCVGRGVAKEEDIELARRLAKALHGEVGCSRPVAEDLHWMPEENYIGISGQVIKPSVYFGIGISGQIQHISGIRDSKTIIAIDKNENAPMIEVADYALIGDLYEILPLLLEKLGA